MMQARGAKGDAKCADPITFLASELLNIPFIPFMVADTSLEGLKEISVSAASLCCAPHHITAPHHFVVTSLSNLELETRETHEPKKSMRIRQRPKLVCLIAIFNTLITRA